MSTLSDSYRLSSAFSKLRFCALLFSLLVSPKFYQETCIAQEGEVIIIRGLAGHWPNAEKLQEKLANQGYRSRVIWCHQRARLFQQIRHKWECGENVRPAAIIGFSLGASNAQFLAYDLLALKIDVPLLILIDGPVFDYVPQNVGICLHLHRDNLVETLLPRPLAGNRYIREKNAIVHLKRGTDIEPLSSGTQVVNFQLPRRGGLSSFLYDNHLTLPGGGNFQASLARLVATLSIEEQSAIYLID